MKKWTEILQPKKGILELHLKELWKYKDLIVLLVRRDFVALYKQTILGPLWYIIQPVLTTVMFTIIFGKLAGLSTDGLPKMLFYMAGTVSWSYFSTCLIKTSNTFRDNAGIFGKVFFPRLAVPISVIISNLITFGIQLLLFVVLIFYYSFKGFEFHFTNYMFALPFLVILMALLSLGLGIIVSSLTTKYRDLSQLVSFGVQLFMFATPVIYPLSSLPEKYQFWMLLNPMSSIIESFRFIFLGTGHFDFQSLLYSTILILVILFIGLVLFNRIERTFMDTV